MKFIELSKNYKALVDDSDYENLLNFKWHTKTSRKETVVYAQTNIKNILTNKWKCVTMHRLILNLTDPKIFVDHINGDTLDNRKENLRICINAQNVRNRLKKKKTKSIFKGVGFKYGKWIARISINNKRIFLGSFILESDAAIAYNEAAITYHKEFAKLNKIKDNK